ncbi:unnamed protein product [Ambrosiozyma monospora]|uniref:Unnamed protein product n=1 Tax=Ambrosiozyma monospora TaxID=43982 RepID=A0A9W6Z577_AMBMO|nr:unnamed protein product [Ambrosiozyma monospora]
MMGPDHHHDDDDLQLTLQEYLEEVKVNLKRLQESSTKFDQYLKALKTQLDNWDSLPFWRKFALRMKLFSVNLRLKYYERNFINKDGLKGKGRDWFKHIVFASGRYTGYAGQQLPALGEAIEDNDYSGFVEALRGFGPPIHNISYPIMSYQRVPTRSKSKSASLKHPTSAWLREDEDQHQDDHLELQPLPKFNKNNQKVSNSNLLQDSGDDDDDVFQDGDELNPFADPDPAKAKNKKHKHKRKTHHNHTLGSSTNDDDDEDDLSYDADNDDDDDLNMIGPSRSHANAIQDSTFTPTSQNGFFGYGVDDDEDILPNHEINDDELEDMEFTYPHVNFNALPTGSRFKGKKLLYFTSIFSSIGVYLFGFEQGVMSIIITEKTFLDYFNNPNEIQIVHNYLRSPCVFHWWFTSINGSFLLGHVTW